jgi:hypothetical protein
MTDKKYRLECKCGNVQYTDNPNLESNLNCRLLDYQGKCTYTVIKKGFIYTQTVYETDIAHAINRVRHPENNDRFSIVEN